MSLNTRIWQEEEGKPIFRIQTEDEAVHIFLSHQKGFNLVGWGINLNLWIYLGKFNSLQQARTTLQKPFFEE